jgi:hypothetical protein
MFVWFFSFFKRFAGVYIITLKPTFGFNFSVVISSWLIFIGGLFIKFSIGVYKAWLIEHGGYEILYSRPQATSAPTTKRSVSTVLWYAFLSTAGVRFILFVFALKDRVSESLEKFFRNAKWLEKETGEMHDWYFSNKRDRRALFLIPLLYWAPLRKVFPASGFYELRLNPKDGTLYPTHVTWLD